MCRFTCIPLLLTSFSYEPSAYLNCTWTWTTWWKIWVVNEWRRYKEVQQICHHPWQSLQNLSRQVNNELFFSKTATLKEVQWVINILLFGSGQDWISQWPLKAIGVVFCSVAHCSLPQKVVSGDMTLQSLYTLRNDRFCTGAFLIHKVHTISG